MRKNKNKLVAVIMAFGMTIVPITQVNAMEIGNIDEIVESKTDTSDFGDDYEESSSFEIRSESVSLLQNSPQNAVFLCCLL